jgi:hypothetical protein
MVTIAKPQASRQQYEVNFVQWKVNMR